jgi:UDP-2,3-diacylglucosamine pyrophosphatase LpxH
MKYKSLFISDIHLGTGNTQTDKLLEFLKENEFENIFLVGDIIDMLMMKRKFYWKKRHNKVVQKLLKMSKNSNITYIVGNHDIFLETFIGEKFGNIQIEEKVKYTTSQGERCLIIHGHQFDGALMTYTWLYHIGSLAYDFSMWLNRYLNKLRSFLNLEYWSLSMYLKSKTKEAIKFVNNFEKIVTDYAKNEEVNTVIAGHIHMKEDKVIDDIRYMNCGCFTEFTSCIIEDLNGNLKVIDV